MKSFNDLCKLAEQFSPEEYTAIVSDKAAAIIPALRALTDDPDEATTMFASFIMASVYADGKLDEAEYELLLPMLELVFGEGFDYESAKKLVKAFKPEGKELKKAVDYLVDFIGLLSEDLKNDIVILCLLVCAVDGKITAKEKSYIKQLVR